MQLWQALLLGALQGVSELFPVSSLAHTILIPAILNWSIDQEASNFLAFVVALHLATAIALLIYFWQDWKAIILAYVGSFQRRTLVYDNTSKFAWLLVAGTIPVGIFGLIFEKQLRKFFEDPKLYWVVALILVINGGVMLYGEYLRRRANRLAAKTGAAEVPHHYAGPDADRELAVEGQLKNVEDLSYGQGAGVGASQILALFPGISRSGVSMVGGLLAGLSHEEAARFSFMLATPVIGLAALLKVPDLLKPEARDILGMTVLAAILAGITAYLSVRFLMRYFETKRMSPFGFYCIYAGLIALIILQLRG
ncbi:MAG TPA: undecaprenyl-diphosphate phosphatase [Chloroflexia bacterium]|nr:undecaprenyl-diphosphate phosphatase [Chloroflexia bacterium]